MSEKNRIKKIIQRALTFALSLVITITSIPINYNGEAATGDNGELKVNANGTVSAIDGPGWQNYRQGYRFYMIDTYCNRVSDVYDFVFTNTTGVGKTFTSIPTPQTA